MDEFKDAALVEACMVDGMSIREASRVVGLHRDTVRKMLEYSVPPGYRWRKPPRRPKISPYTGVIDRILEDDLNLPWKQRYTAKRIHDRQRDEYDFDGGYRPSTSLRSDSTLLRSSRGSAPTLSVRNDFSTVRI